MSDSVSQWLHQLKMGDETAVQPLWERDFERLASLARKRLGVTQRRVADEEDVALSVFRHLCDGAARGQFSDVENRDELWRVLVVMTANKVTDQRRCAEAQKRGGGNVRGDSVFNAPGLSDVCNGFDQIIGEDPTPEFLALMADEHERLMTRLAQPTLQQVAIFKMEGYTNDDIADRLGCSVRTVERRLRLIRKKWQQEEPQ